MFKYSEDGYMISNKRCMECGHFLVIWPDTMDEDSPPEGVNWDTGEFCEYCHADQNE